MEGSETVRIYFLFFLFLLGDASRRLWQSVQTMSHICFAVYNYIILGSESL